MTCRVITGVLLLAWVAGVALFFINMNIDSDALDLLVALTLTPLGLPWNLAPIFTGGSPGLRMIIALAAPALNIIIVWGLCRAVMRRVCPGC